MPPRPPADGPRRWFERPTDQGGRWGRRSAVGGGDVARFVGWIEEEFGLIVPPHRQERLLARLVPRLAASGVHSFREYVQRVCDDPGDERARLADVLTNNETYFLRDVRQFEDLVGPGLDRLNQTRPAAGREFRVLCAGCSSGEEAYTVNFFLHDYAWRLGGGTTRVEAFDLDPRQIAVAQRAHYRRWSARDLTDAQIGRYLITRGPDQYEVRPRYRGGLRFFVGNLLKPETFHPAAEYDVVFCRNVIIYFSAEAIRRTIDNFVSVLRPGGLLFLGHSESIRGLTPALKLVRLNDSVAYERQTPENS